MVLLNLMNKKYIRYIVFLLNISIALCDLYNDAMKVGVSNAYTNISRGYSCVGINPANLALNTNFMLDLGSFSFGVKNNSFSFNDIVDINGSNMADSTQLNYYNKNKLKDLINREGIIVSNHFRASLPALKMSMNKYALVTDTKVYSEIGVPSLLLELLFFGNVVGERVPFNIPYNIQAVQETSFSYGSQYKDIYYGLSVKHLFGLFHSDLYAIDSSYFLTDTSSFVMEGSYLLRQGLGGSGFSLDLGLLTKEFFNGYQFGFSLVNIFGQINWSNNNFLRGLTEGVVNSIIPKELQLRPNEYIYYHFSIDSLTAETISSNGTSGLVKTNDYPVIKVANLEDVDSFSYNNDLVVSLPDSSGYLVPSDQMSNGFIERYTENNEFITDYPTLLRMAVSKKMLDDAIIEIDFLTSFSNGMGYTDKWQMSLGTEVFKFPSYPIRFGFMFSNSGTSISLGSGIHKNKFNYDYAISLYDGISISKAKGLKLALSLSWK